MPLFMGDQATELSGWEVAGVVIVFSSLVIYNRKPRR